MAARCEFTSNECVTLSNCQVIAFVPSAFPVELLCESWSGSKKNGRGKGRGEKETLAGPYDSGKPPLIFHSLTNIA